MTSYGKAQKVVNVRRNRKLGVMVEVGKLYADFRRRGHTPPSVDALHGAHQRGNVPRDVKPQNILIRRDKQPVLADLKSVSKYSDLPAKAPFPECSTWAAAETPPDKSRTAPLCEVKAPISTDMIVASERSYAARART